MEVDPQVVKYGPEIEPTIVQHDIKFLPTIGCPALDGMCEL